MAQFSRRTILSATDILADRTNSEIDRFALEHGLESVAVGPSKADKTNAIGHYLIKNPLLNNEYEENLSDAVIIAILGRAIERSFSGYPSVFSFTDFQSHFAVLNRGLERDGFTVEDGTLRRTLPGIVDLPSAEDEVHLLLDRFGLQVPGVHLDQGISAHVRGQWPGANAQFRTFIESLLDEIALRAPAPTGGYPPTGHARRQWLANVTPPFFIAELNEWSHDGKGFFEAFFRRLCPEGSHPGLSNEEDSTFRFHLVLLVGRHLLRRLQAMVGRP
jgi:hypothetical protein